jgi:hypothetical protein
MQPSQDPRLTQAIQVRDELAHRYLHLSGVSLIDIGFDPDSQGPSRTPVVRVHVKDEATRMALDIPKAAGDIPIQVIVSNFKLE